MHDTILIRNELLGKPNWYEGLKKQCAREKKNTSGMSFEERQFHGVLEDMKLVQL